MQNELIDLQTQLSFQEDTIAQLNEVVTRQQKDIVQLLAEVKRLKELYRSLAANAKPENPEHEIPPHY